MRIGARELALALALALIALALAGVAEGIAAQPPAFVLIALSLLPALAGAAIATVPLTHPRAARVVASVGGLVALICIGVALMTSLENPADRAARLRLGLGLMAFSLAVLQIRLLARVAPSKPPVATRGASTDEVSPDA